MFSKASIVPVLALAASYASALTIGSIATNLTSGGPITITWTSTSTDPSEFTIELGEKSFNNFFAIANNVQTSAGSISLELPGVPTASDYSLEFVNISDINQVFATTSSEFSIAAALSSSSVSSTSTAPVTSPTVSVSGVTTSGGTTLTETSSSSGFGITQTPSGSTTSGASSESSVSSSSTSSSSSSTGTSFNNGAGSFKAFTVGSGTTSSLLMAAGAIVGAMFVGF